MNKQKVLFSLPYILLILANFIYIYANGMKPIGEDPELILYNILLFLLVGGVVMLHINYLLYQWFVKE